MGTVAGNLMVKHRQPTFSSDVFLLLETVGATLVIGLYFVVLLLIGVTLVINVAISTINFS